MNKEFKVFDTVIFEYDLEMIKFRFEEVGPLVDYIIILESKLVLLIKTVINEDPYAKTNYPHTHAKKKEADEIFPEVLKYYLETGCSIKELSQKFNLPPHAISQRISKYFKELSNKKIDETLTLTDKVGNKKFKISDNVKNILSSVFKGLNKISEKNTEIEELAVDQAIMKMDLANLPALVFINSANQRLNVVYHRKDGNISWIDPEINNG